MAKMRGVVQDRGCGGKGIRTPELRSLLKGNSIYQRGQSTILDRNLVYAFISRWLFPVTVSVLTAGLHSPQFSFGAVLRSAIVIPWCCGGWIPPSLLCAHRCRSTSPVVLLPLFFFRDQFSNELLRIDDPATGAAIKSSSVRPSIPSRHDMVNRSGIPNPSLPSHPSHCLLHTGLSRIVD